MKALTSDVYKRQFIYRLEVARSCRRKNDTGVCQDYQQEEGRGCESCKRFVSLMEGIMWSMSNLQTSITAFLRL